MEMCWRIVVSNIVSNLDLYREDSCAASVQLQNDVRKRVAQRCPLWCGQSAPGRIFNKAACSQALFSASDIRFSKRKDAESTSHPMCFPYVWHEVWSKYVWREGSKHASHFCHVMSDCVSLSHVLQSCQTVTSQPACRFFSRTSKVSDLQGGKKPSLAATCQSGEHMPIRGQTSIIIGGDGTKGCRATIKKEE